jgi:hypothetical protein
MALRQILELPSASVEIEERAGYLFVVEKGQLRDLADLRQYVQHMDAVIASTGIDRAIIDARGEVGSPPEEVRGAMWDWLCASTRGFSLVAFVLPSEMAVARVNMTALARRAPVRAFDSVQSAQRWLVRGGSRASSASVVGLAAITDSTPPPDDAKPSAFATTERPPPPKTSSSAPPPAASVPPLRSGFRPPTAGPVERVGNPRDVRAPEERAVRKSDVHRRAMTPPPSSASQSTAPQSTKKDGRG